jgi:hypothetical protein
MRVSPMHKSEDSSPRNYSSGAEDLDPAFDYPSTLKDNNEESLYCTFHIFYQAIKPTLKHVL